MSSADGIDEKRFGVCAFTPFDFNIKRWFKRFTKNEVFFLFIIYTHYFIWQSLQRNCGKSKLQRVRPWSSGSKKSDSLWSTSLWCGVFFFFFPYGWQDLHRLRHAGAPAKPLWTHVLSDAFCWFYSQHMPQREQGSSNCRITLRANNCLKQSVQTNCCWVFWGRPADGRALQCFAAEKNTDSAWNWLIWSTLFF